MKTVLVADDELAIADLLREILEGEGYRVVTTANGQQALDWLASGQADLIISDLMMPVLDGSGLIRGLKAKPAFAGIPLILMSAVVRPEVLLDTNHDAFLAKPFEIGEVLDLVERLIGKAN